MLLKIGKIGKVLWEQAQNFSYFSRRLRESNRLNLFDKDLKGLYSSEKEKK